MDEPAQTVEIEPADLQLVEPLVRATGWLKFLGALSLGVGVLQCLSVVGLLTGWLPIWIGVVSLRSAKRLEDGFRSRDRAELSRGTEDLAKALKLQGIWMIVALTLTAVYVGGLLLWLVLSTS